MGSVGNQNPWSPYDAYKECSLGICSIYCPQFCYFIFSPPPPPDSSSPFSPLIIAIIGLLASAFLLVSYYTIVTRYCKRSGNQNSGLEENNHDQVRHEQWQQVPSSGLDDAIISSFAVCKYQRGQGVIEGSECAVCLTEFEEDESLRLLPKCSHAFHLPCIDTWLKSQSSCPLCRANVTPCSPPAQTSYDVDSTEAQMMMPNGVILVVDGQEYLLKSPELRRSISLGAFPFERKLDILKNQQVEDVGSSIKRCHSTGRFTSE